MESAVIKRLLNAIDHREAVALVTVTHKVGSGPRDKGSMMLVDHKGTLLAGTIGGGGVEESAKQDAMACLKNQTSSAFSYELTLKETENALGMACGGAVTVFIKVFSVGKSLIIFGAGHIGMVLSKMAKLLEYHVTIVDERDEYANVARFESADVILSGEMQTLLADLEIVPSTSVVIVTHGHTHDLEVLRGVLNHNAGYIGMIGSKSKVNYCFQTLRAEGVSEEKLSAVHAPIGLDIGGETPSEIALSIMAEIQAIQFGKQGPFMKQIEKGGA
ncbi:XdhC family protein [Fusibacter sp. 3D3]|uniref:XdhC family protein n=1 Tax=Fusibacter sp. 3D3 TaxID=1048380 RepID=UPI000853B64B|nr:XdhC/CoxI family protein [Fusibacter sp. 3D3]GAU77098.1 xanthine and CO dehydrogenases maturation factor [Fusibacter sp. 3D3]